ncbi:MAG: SH3 domain-containing protein, partial [Acidobacteria bacterium]|nr:SH3 domain-containing protein [Acidobacteriota bacterium]
MKAFQNDSRLLALALLPVLLVPGCSDERSKAYPAGYVTAPKVTLRDRLSEVYNKVATVENGERVEVLETHKRMVRVRTAGGQVGWMEQRYLAGEDVFQTFQKLAAQNQRAPVAARALTRAIVNMRARPGRDGERLYQMPEGEKLDLLKRTTANKPVPAGTAPPENDDDEPAPKPLEDWWLVRNTHGHVGWVLGRMLDVDVPLEVAQYAEGQRIVASFVLNEVEDRGRRVPQYLMLLSEPKDGLPDDYNQARVFTWNPKRSRYETAYRER